MSKTAKVIRLEPELQRHVRGRLARLPAAAHALHERGKESLAKRLEVYFDAVDDALFDMADKANSNQEQNLFFDSMREVRVQRKSVEKRFFEGVDESFAGLVEPDQRDKLMPEGELSADALSLVQNDDLEQIVALEATVGRANRAHQNLVGRLSYGMKSLVKVPVTLLNNPFGPAVLCTAFMSQIKRLDIDIKAKLVLFKLFDRVVIDELPSTYKNLEAVLSQHDLEVSAPNTERRGVTPPSSGSVKHQVPGDASPQMFGEGANGDGTGGAGRSDSQGTSRQLDATGSEPGSPRQPLMELLSFVQKLPNTPLSVDGNKSNGIEQTLSRVQKHKGQVLTLSAVEKETIRLVQMLFEFILRDTDLDGSIKQLLFRLQIPVLKVALADKAFLTDKRHVARRLLNEMAAQAIGWQADGSDAAVKEPLVQRIRSITEGVVSQFDQDVGVFKDALAEFTAFVEQDRRRTSALEQRMVDAEDGKARAESARKVVGDILEGRLQFHILPTVVNDLIRGPLSNVLFVTALKFGFDSLQWSEQIALLDDIIWSVQANVDRQQLIAKAPNVILRLRSGLDAVSYNPFEVSELILGLEDIHIARMRGAPVEHPKDAALTTVRAPAVEPAAVSAPKIKDTKKGVEKAAESVVDSDLLADDDPHMRIVTAFTQGSWYDLVDENGKPLRCRLAAYIKPTGKYIFVNRAGMKTTEKSQQDLALALKNGSLRPVDSGMLFDRALENIVTGMRSSKSSSPLDEFDKD